MQRKTVERKTVEQRVAARYHPRADLLKVASQSGSQRKPDLDDPPGPPSQHPRWAIISVGARNTFGHPRIEILKRLQDAAITFLTSEFKPGDVGGVVIGSTIGTRVDSSSARMSRYLST